MNGNGTLVVCCGCRFDYEDHIKQDELDQCQIAVCGEQLDQRGDSLQKLQLVFLNQESIEENCFFIFLCQLKLAMVTSVPWDGITSLYLYLGRHLFCNFK